MGCTHSIILKIYILKLKLLLKRSCNDATLTSIAPHALTLPWLHYLPRSLTRALAVGSGTPYLVVYNLVLRICWEKKIKSLEFKKIIIFLKTSQRKEFFLGMSHSLLNVDSNIITCIYETLQVTCSWTNKTYESYALIPTSHDPKIQVLWWNLSQHNRGG